MRKLNAKRRWIPPGCFFAQHEIDLDKVYSIECHLRDGGSVPPVVAIRYGAKYLPIDGHHRLTAAARLGYSLKAWVIDGDRFESLDQKCRMRDDGKRAEDFILCDGVPALAVALAP